MIQLTINYEERQKHTAIDFHKAQKQYEISKLKEQLAQKIETARYLAGKKRGAWGLTTTADHKRNAAIDNLRFQIKMMEININQ